MKQNILCKSLSVLLLSSLGFTACYANNSIKIVDVSLYENSHDGVSVVTVGEDSFRTNFGALRKCGIPTLTIFDKKNGNPYENQDVQLTSKAAIGDYFPWIITISIKNHENVTAPKFYKITFDSNFNDQDCSEKNGSVSEIEINPYVLSTNDEIKKIAIKNNYSQEIEITNINNMDKNGLIMPPKLPEPIKIPAGETYDFELQPRVCPENSGSLSKNEDIQFSYKITDSGTSLEGAFTIKVRIVCNETLDQAIDEIEETDLTTTAREKMLAEETDNAQKRYAEITANLKKIKQWADIAQKDALDAAVEAAVKKCEQKSEKNKKKAIDAAVKKTIKEEASRKQEVNFRKQITKKARESKEDL
jgi:hypothetical protein